MSLGVVPKAKGEAAEAAIAGLRVGFGSPELDPDRRTTNDERTALLEPVETNADADLVREMPAFAAERLMES